jgi:hypothetical protein
MGDGSRPENGRALSLEGSTPSPSALVLVEQPGVLATLSRWRSWVQIPSGTLAGIG